MLNMKKNIEEITIDANKCYIDWEEFKLFSDWYEWKELTFRNREEDLPEEWKFNNWRLREKDI